MADREQSKLEQAVSTAIASSEVRGAGKKTSALGRGGPLAAIRRSARRFERMARKGRSGRGPGAEAQVP